MTSHLIPRACRGILIALTLAATGLAQAANDYFLQIDGIKGGSVDKTHKDWIDIESFSWGLTKTTTSGGGGAGVGKVSFSDLSWAQYVDASTPHWLIAVAKGTNIRKATLDVTRDGGKGTGELFFQLIFTDTTGTSLNVTGGGDSLMANASMTSGAIVKMRYLPMGKVSANDWVEGEFNIRANAEKAMFSGDPLVLMGLFSAGGNVSFDASAITPVPEPASAALLIGGLGLLALRRRR